MNEAELHGMRLLELEEVAEVLRLNVRTIRYLVRRGELAAIVMPNGWLRFESQAVEAFIDSHRTFTHH